MTKLALQADINGKNTFGRVPSVNIVAGILTEDTPDSFVVPTAFKFYELIFSYDPGLRVWVSSTTTAVFPVGSTSTSTSELLPSVLVVPGGATISIITPETSASYSCSMYEIP
jgi:hypothetical protein